MISLSILFIERQRKVLFKKFQPSVFHDRVVLNTDDQASDNTLKYLKHQSTLSGIGFFLRLFSLFAEPSGMG